MKIVHFLVSLSIIIFSPLLFNALSINALALQPRQISAKAEGFTVKIEASGKGSGVIIGKRGNIYTVLTCAHVVKKIDGQGTIITSDNNQHQFEMSNISRFDGADLATFTFTSDRSYPIVKVSNSEMRAGDNIYVVGFPSELKDVSGRPLSFIPGNIVSINSSGNSGYNLIYSNQTVEGMSGGAIINQDGELSGIHGRRQDTTRGEKIGGAGIGLRKYKDFIVKSTSSQDNAEFKPKPTLSQSNTTSFKLTKSLSERSFSTSLISPDGNTFIIGNEDGVQVRRTIDSEIIRRFKIDYGQIKSLAISTDGKIVAIGTDRGIEIRKTTNGEILNQINDSEFGYKITMSGDGLTVAASHLTDTIKVWRVSDGKLLQTIVAKNPYLAKVQIDDIVMSSDAQKIVSIGENDSVRIWRVTDGKLLKILPRGEALFRNVSISLDNMLVVASGWASTYYDSGGIIKIWNLSDGKEVRSIRTGRGNTAITGNGVLVSVESQQIKFWKIPTGKSIEVIQTDFDGSPSISADGRIFIVNSYSRNIKIWQREAN